MTFENGVKAALKKAGINARVSMVSDNLAIARQGLMDALPVLEVNGMIVSRNKNLSRDELVRCFRGLDL